MLFFLSLCGFCHGPLGGAGLLWISGTLVRGAVTGGGCVSSACAAEVAELGSTDSASGPSSMQAFLEIAVEWEFELAAAPQG